MATFTVNTLSDVSAKDGLTTLREALVLANANPNADTIVFAPGIAGTLMLKQGELKVSGAVSIDGGGDVVLDGGGKSRVLDINDGKGGRER